MVRFSSLFVRISILLLIATAIWLGRDPLARRWLEYSASQTVGAKVEIGTVKTAPGENSLYLDRLAIADPRSTMKNLVQADSVWLKIDPDSLLRRQFVVDRGTASRVVFGAPRTTTGSLSGTEIPAVPTDQVPEVQPVYDWRSIRESWLDRFQYSTHGMDERSLELGKVAESILERWVLELQQRVSKFDELKTRMGEVQEMIPAHDNPLRNRAKIELARQQLEQLKGDIRLLADDISGLDRKLVQDRSLLLEAKRKDQEKLDAISNQTTLDGETLSRLLLHQDQLQLASEILSWFQVFQNGVPDPGCDFCTASKSGVDIQTTGHPGFLIRTLQIDGEGRLAGTRFNFTGEVANISTEPELADGPVTISLRAQGNTHAVVECTLDRTGSYRNDLVKIHCIDLPIAERLLGDPDSVQVRVSPCRTHVDVMLASREGTLDGRFRFEHSNLVMQIEQLDNRAGGQDAADRINLELASITGYTVEATIAGTVEKPLVNFRSDLGERLAGKFNTAIQGGSLASSEQLDRMLNTTQITLEHEIGDKIRDISQLFESKILDHEKLVTAELESRMGENPGADRLRR